MSKRQQLQNIENPEWTRRKGKRQGREDTN